MVGNDDSTEDPEKQIDRILRKLVHERLSPDHLDAVNDVVQKCWVRLLNLINRCKQQNESIESIGGMCRSVCTFEILSYYRSYYSSRVETSEQINDLACTQSTVQDLEDDEFVNHVLESNFSGFDIVIARKLFAGVSVRVVEQMTGLPQSTIYRRFANIKRRLEEIGKEIESADADGVVND